MPSYDMTRKFGKSMKKIEQLYEQFNSVFKNETDMLINYLKSHQEDFMYLVRYCRWKGIDRQKLEVPKSDKWFVDIVGECVQFYSKSNLIGRYQCVHNSVDLRYEKTPDGVREMRKDHEQWSFICRLAEIYADEFLRHMIEQREKEIEHYSEFLNE